MISNSMKTRIIALLALFAMLVGCNKPLSATQPETDDVMVFPSLCDTFVYESDTIFHAPMHYWDFDKVDSLMNFFNAILSEHPFMVLGEHEQLMNDIGDCIDYLEAYRRGERRYYPDSLVHSCIFGLVEDWAVIYREFEPRNDRCFIEWFLMCTAYYSPDITWFVEGQTTDHCAGFLNIGNPYTHTPCCSYIILKRDKGYEIKLIDDDILVWSIYQLSDESNRTYYLCSYNIPVFFGQWLYWKNEQGEYIKVAENTDAPDECDGNDLFYFDPKKHIWKYSKIDKNGDLKALREKPAFRLVLDGDKSRFE